MRTSHGQIGVTACQLPARVLRFGIDAALEQERGFRYVGLKED